MLERKGQLRTNTVSEDLWKVIANKISRNLLILSNVKILCSFFKTARVEIIIWNNKTFYLLPKPSRIGGRGRELHHLPVCTGWVIVRSILKSHTPVLIWLDVTIQLVAKQLMNEALTVKHEWRSWCKCDSSAQPELTSLHLSTWIYAWRGIISTSVCWM